MKRVLIVDDEKELLFPLQFVLKSDSIDVLTAGSASEALELMASHTVDLVVTDYRMPGKNGLELLEEARNLRTSVPPFILMTGFAEALDSRYRSSEIRQILSKPFELWELEDAVHSALIGRQE